jgi:hypothetical protein
MTVPETAMHEDNFTLSGKNQIRLAGQFRVVQSIAKSRSVQKAPNHHLGVSVLTLDQRHYVAALTSADGIYHSFHPLITAPATKTVLHGSPSYSLAFSLELNFSKFA